MKRSLLLLLFVCAAAKATPTQIRDTGYTGFGGTLFSGRITVGAPDMTTQDGRTIHRWEQSYIISDGVISVDLEPNDTATPAGTSYVAVYRPKSGLAWSERWVVLTSATPLRVNQVRVLNAPLPTVMIQPQQILRGGAASGQCLAWSGASWIPTNCEAGAWLGNAVTIQGAAVADTTPADGQMMRYNGSLSRWEPAKVRHVVTFANTASVTVLGSVHLLGTADLTVTCYTANTPPNIVEPDAWASDPTTFDVTITFSVAHSGRCVLR